MKLSKETFQQTSRWMKRNARPLEAARWEYLFEGGSREKVIQLIAAYQNEDGGFGHGIEPDFWLPHSSPMATWVACRILQEVEASANEEIVMKVVAYLEQAYHSDSGLWSTVLPENNNYPHAPWWHWKEGSQEHWMFNPSVELAAYLIGWSAENSTAAQIGWATMEKAVEYVMDKVEMDMHEISNFLRAIQLLEPYKEQFHTKTNLRLQNVSRKVMELADQCVEKDVTAWTSGYVALPLDFVDTPSHPLNEIFGTLMKQNLDLFVQQLSGREVWDIPWGWADYPEEFTIARRYWQGVLAVNRFKLLQTFDYLE